MSSGKYRVLTEIQRAVTTQDATYGTTGAPTWTPTVVQAGSPTVAAPMWAEWQDVLPSRDERLTQGVVIGAVRSRVRFPYWSTWRTNLDGTMRLVRRDGSDSNWNVIGGPVLVDNNREVEVMAEQLTT